MYYPKHMNLKRPRAWLGHVPFAYDLVKSTKPKILVELGTHFGCSYFSFLDSVLENGLSTKCYAIDTWEGDEQAGHYNNEIFEFVDRYNQKYSDQSNLLRMTFNEARAEFGNKKIDLLHIDGLHTYDAVSNDFKTWTDAVSEEGVILFHDTSVIKTGFGVKKFWSELIEEYPTQCFNFEHSNGLGIFIKNKSKNINTFLYENFGLEPEQLKAKYERNEKQLIKKMKKKDFINRFLPILAR